MAAATPSRLPSLRPTAGPRSGQRTRHVLLALHWYSVDIHRGIAQYSQEVGWVLDTDLLRVGLPADRWARDGVLCIMGMDPAFDRDVLNHGIPVVNIGYTVIPGVPRVCSEARSVGAVAARHFLERGHRHFAYYRRSRTPGEDARYAAFRDALAAAGHPLHLLDYAATAGADRAGTDLGGRLAWLRDQLQRLPKPVAVTAEFDDRAIEVLEAALEAGIRVPEDAAVLGVGNDELRCPFAPVPLSSIDDNEVGIGYEAARLLDRLMAGEAVPGNAVVEVAPRHVVVRRSSDLVAVEHPLVARALRFIWDHYGDPITTRHVCAAVPMSRRRLHDAFVRHVGRSMAAEIARVRLDHACRLLRRSDAKLLQIAADSGFGDPLRMNATFRRCLHTTPGAWRAAAADRPPHPAE